MGLVNKNNEDAGKALEKMMEKFEIDLDDAVKNTEENSSDRNKRRKEKIEKDKLGF